jgi:predicted permease
MGHLSRFQRYLGSLLGKLGIADEVDQELAFHVEMRTRELIARGMEPEAARAAAIARFGNLAGVKRHCRKIAQGRDRRMSTYVWFEQLRQDLVFAARQLRRNPLLTTVVTLILAIAIAANTTVFSVGNTVLLAPLPFPQPEQLVRIHEATPEGKPFSVSAPNFIDLAEQSRPFAEIAAVYGLPLSYTMLDQGDPRRCSALAASGSLFEVLGIEPALGRSFSAEEDQPGSDYRVLVITHGLWQRQLGSNPDIIGETISLDGEGWTVIGVLPADFDFLGGPDIWVPVAADPASDRGDHRLEVFARLRPGVSLAQARADLDAVAAHLGAQYPESNQGWGFFIRSFSDWLIPERARQATLVLSVAVVLMLLLACANVSNLLIVRVTNRHQEIGTRVALGASHARVIRQLLTESMLLAVLGAGLGLLLSLWAVATIRAVAAQALPRLDELAIDSRVLLVTLAITLAVGLLSGLAPALQISGDRLAAVLKSARQGVTLGTRRLHDVLVVVELSLALMLLIGAGLLARSYVELNRINPGFNPEQVITAEVNLPPSRYSELGAETAGLFREVIQGIETTPGVSAVGATMVNPFQGLRPANQVADETVRDRSKFVPCQFRIVTPGFFEAMGVPLLQGRSFNSSDRPPAADAQTPPELVAVISASLAERVWPGSDPVGRRLRWETPEGMLVTVVGVVPEVRDVALAAEPLPTLYLNHEQAAWPAMTLIIKTAGEPTGIAGAVRRALWAVDKNLPGPVFGRLQDNLSDQKAGPRLNTQLLGIFAVLALLIAAMGVYGVIAYRVTRSHRDLGLRMALGAEGRDLVGLVLRQGLRLVALAVGMGILGALALTRFLASLLYGVSATNPATFVAVALLFLVVAAMACYLPARRVARLDPVIALRAE